MDDDLTDEEVRLQSDELILDYLLWTVTQSLLDEVYLRTTLPDSHRWLQSSTDATRFINLANHFYNRHIATYAQDPLPPPLLARLRLATFTTLFLRRLSLTSPTLLPPRTLRPFLASRTTAWLATRCTESIFDASVFTLHTPFPRAHMDRSLNYRLRELGLFSPATTLTKLPPPQQGCADLLSCLWSFLVLSAHSKAAIGEHVEYWLQLAVTFCMHAFLEAYRVHGESGAEAANICFAWGDTPAVPVPAPGSAQSEEERQWLQEDFCISEMFAAVPRVARQKYWELRKEAVLMVAPDEEKNECLEELCAKHAKECSWAEFEGDVVGFVEMVVREQEVPVLVGLEVGRVGGFEDEDVGELLHSLGFGPRMANDA